METYWALGRRSSAFAITSGHRVFWDHLIYAYMIENTRIFEIVQRVLREYRYGEALGVARLPSTYQWIDSTEELFYKDASPFQRRSQVSRIRPDIRANRRNAYFRMFGMDLNHGGDGGPYPYEKAAAANRGFVSTFEEFLRQVWVGIENRDNTSGARPTDDDAIADYATQLQDMLNTRRGPARAALAREEFDYVSTMSWLHLTVLFNTPVLDDLQIAAESPEERLHSMGERVGIPAHAQSHSYFILAPALSTLLLQIEAGLYNTTADAPALYEAVAPRELMMTIVTHWSRVTGRDLKAPPVALTGRARAPQFELASPTTISARRPAAPPLAQPPAPASARLNGRRTEGVSAP
jgi:hypothetical protein